MYAMWIGTHIIQSHFFLKIKKKKKLNNKLITILLNQNIPQHVWFEPGKRLILGVYILDMGDLRIWVELDQMSHQKQYELIH